MRLWKPQEGPHRNSHATLGVVSISSSRDYLAGLMQQVERAAMRIADGNGADVVDSFLEIE